MENFIIVAILVCILCGAGFYLYRAKKRGEKCIGCPYARQCGSKCGGGCTHTDKEKDSKQ